MTFKRIPMSTFAQLSSLRLTDYTGLYAATEFVRDIGLQFPDQATRNSSWDTVKQSLVLTRETFNEALTALATGKHVILFGPPGTGKTTLAKLIASAFNCASTLKTATADWSTYDTVGGLRVTSQGGREKLVPFDGAVVETVVKCCNRIGAWSIDNSLPQAEWLILDELNRAKMDAAFGQFFTALDERQGLVSLDHYQDHPLNRSIYVPNRFRIIGTMNNYDKNFLFQLSYALTRRFAFVYIGVPTKEQFEEELSFMIAETYRQAGAKIGVTSTEEDFKSKHSLALAKVASFIRRLRGYDLSDEEREQKVTRDIGSAQFLDALRHAVFAAEIHQLDAKGAADQAIATHITPQLDGLGARLADLAKESVAADMPNTKAALLRYSRFGM